MLCRGGLQPCRLTRSHKTPKCRVQCPAHTSFLRPERSTAACQKQARVDPTVHAAAGLTTLQQAAGVLDPSLQSTESENSLDTTSVQTNEPAKVLGQVLICKSETLQPETHYAAAVDSLKAAAQNIAQQYKHYDSGVVRLEVPLPRGITALRWLQGQAQGLQPRIYFSPRQSSAPGTQGAAAAEAATAGAGPVAGLGSAWLWQGVAGQALSPETVQEIASFLSTAHPRLRVFGGSRFNTSQMPAAEWADFGSYCFFMPRLEVLEAATCTLLSCNIAWHADADRKDPNKCSTIHYAVNDTLSALDAVQIPAAPAAPAFQITRESVQHLPDEEGWANLMEPLHDSLATSQLSTDRLPQLHQVEPGVAKTEYEMNGQGGLDQLLAALDGGVQGLGQAEPEAGLTKIVLARRSDIKFTGKLDPLVLLEALQERDPRSYQILLQQPGGACFLGSTPEQLYIRSGSAVASEAVAATRPRGPPGDIEKDFWYAFDLLRSSKDHVEFTLVRDFVRDALAEVCSQVRVDTEKSVLKQGAVQHLYGRLSGQLQPDVNDAELLCPEPDLNLPRAAVVHAQAALHPTPAVCGRPRAEAKAVLAESEPFDRGYYAGPFGWISGSAAEFVVAIRSALMQAPQHQSVQPSRAEIPLSNGLDRGVTYSTPTGLNGASRGSTNGEYHPSTVLDSSRERRNGNSSNSSSSNGAQSTLYSTAAQQQQSTGAKDPSAQAAAAAQTISLFAGVGIVKGSTASSEWQELELKARQFQMLLQPVPSLKAAPNVNALWAGALVEELCRHGIHTFGVAPGSRSSALTLAVAMHPRARITTCIDERSLGFWALGHASATGRPAAVITSSGTAVANLLPAVVEASQSEVPMLLLTADRPSELRDTGANQTIDQVKIFGGYVRWAVDVPPPDHVMPLRSLLTTVDTAVRFASDLPAGPVHMNCQFREPLAPAAAAWPSQLLKGTQHWMQSESPFTSPVNSLSSSTFVTSEQMSIASQLGSAQRGLLVIAHLASHQDVVAALKIAQALRWPVVADALSGLRVAMPKQAAEQLTVLHQFDQVLLDKASWPALKPDVVLQLGSHMVSKRTLQFLEWSALDDEDLEPLVWMHADSSSKRMDEKHLVSHRLQLPLPQLAHMLSQAVDGRRPGQQAVQYKQLLEALNEVAHLEVNNWLKEQSNLSEPYAARRLSQLLPSGNGLFIGNSMPIRDMDMYAAWQQKKRQQGQVSAGSGCPVGSNRGASGIDGVLSTAAGFAAGLKRPVTLVVGDVSFLHDINGLNLLRTGDLQPAVTVVLINNAGGGIFSFLPIADSLQPEVFTPLWATPQNVDLAGMCRAQGIAHQKVTAVQDLTGALQSAWSLKRHSVVEVITGRDSNVDQHRQLQAAVQQAVHQAHTLLLPNQPGGSGVATFLEPMPILSARWHRYSLPLKRPLTTGAGSAQREGLLLRLTLQAGKHQATGVGEIAPLPGLHQESVEEAEQQLALVCELLTGVHVPYTLALMQGRIGCWIKANLGLDSGRLFPSVKAGLEGALLTALANGRGMSLAALLMSAHVTDHQLLQAAPANVFINGLLDCDGSLEECVSEARKLVAQGFFAIKLKVARRRNPLADAAVLLAIRHAVGPAVVLRADANRRWTLHEAVAFGQAVAAAGLQYVEEPVQKAADLAELYQQTHMPIALDETLDELVLGCNSGQPDINLGDKVQELVSALPHKAIVALVVKPGVVGGFENTLAVAKAAAKHDIQVVISSAFESSLGLAQYACLAGLLGQGLPASKETLNHDRHPPLTSSAKSSNAYANLKSQSVHGLGTENWFIPDQQPASLLQPLCACWPSTSPAHIGTATPRQRSQDCLGQMSISLSTASDVIDNIRLDSIAVESQTAQASAAHETVCTVRTSKCTFNVRVLTYCQNNTCASQTPNLPENRGSRPDDCSITGGPRSKRQQPAVLFLHGFMGSADDWRPIMHALSATHHCVAIDLPGHANTRLTGEEGYAFEETASAIAALVDKLDLRGCTLVGYSMGARVALHLASFHHDLFGSVVSISGSPGIADPVIAAARRARDASMANALVRNGLQAFAESWYEQPMWSSLRAHPRFASIIQQRSRLSDPDLLAKSLVGMSLGRQPYLGTRLAGAARHCNVVLVAGSEDTKFVKIAERMVSSTRQQQRSPDKQSLLTIVLIQHCGHAVHIDSPEAILRLLTLS